jgi:hypothetical protein
MAMDEPIVGTIDLTTGERYYTAKQLAFICEDESEISIWRLREQGLIAPVLFKGAHQYHVSASFRVTCFRALQAICGRSSAIPAKVIKAVGPEIDRLCSHDKVGRQDLDNALSKAVLDVILTPEVRAVMERNATRIDSGHRGSKVDQQQQQQVRQ